jgi:hypothetical protein
MVTTMLYILRDTGVVLPFLFEVFDPSDIQLVKDHLNELLIS